MLSCVVVCCRVLSWCSLVLRLVVAIHRIATARVGCRRGLYTSLNEIYDHVLDTFPWLPVDLWLCDMCCGGRFTALSRDVSLSRWHVRLHRLLSALRVTRRALRRVCSEHEQVADVGTAEPPAVV